MEKLVNESLDSFLAERKWRDEDNPGGPIRNAMKAARSAPARALRRKRARAIMQKYKTKIERKVDEILGRYSVNVDTLVTKIKARVSTAKASPAPDEVKSHQYEDILDDLRSSMEGILRSARDAVNDYMKTFEDAFQQRLDRPGTLTGTEFMPEDKTNLLSEWRSIVEELNYYIQTKLLDFVDLISIAELSEVKAELKKFIEDQRGYNSGAEVWPSDDPSTIPPGGLEEKIYDFWVTTLSRMVNYPYQINSTPGLGSYNGSKAKWIKFIIHNDKLGYVFLDQKGGYKTAGHFVKFFPDPDFHPFSIDPATGKDLKDWRKIQNKLDTFTRALP